MLDELLRQAREVLDALDATLKVFTGPVDSSEATIGVARDDAVYKMLTLLNEIVATRVRGEPEVFDQVLAIGDRRHDDAGAQPMRNAWRSFENDLIALFMRSYHVTKMESQLLAEGRTAMNDLFVLAIAATQSVVGFLFPEVPAFYSHDFQCVRAHSLMATEQQAERPIDQLSVRQVMLALHAVYSNTTRLTYTDELGVYTGHLLRRALDLLVTSGDDTVWDNRHYRTWMESHKHWRYSTAYLREITTVYYALADLFDLGKLTPVEHDAYKLLKPDEEMIGRAKRWFERFLHHEPDAWVRDHLVPLSLYAGEAELYHREHRGQQDPAPVIIKEHRVMDFMHLTASAVKPSGVVAAQEINDRTPSLHLSLIVLSTFKARIRSAQQMLDPNLFVLLQPEMRRWACLMRNNPRRPMLVLFFSHVQLYWDGRLWMYNNVFEALCAWMRVVEERCLRQLEGFDVGSLLDDFFRPDETAKQAVVRLGALQGAHQPQLGLGGMY